tara:strand:+ start:92 stop:823 length:732 start_codon:yes stop_codon:yes gene_type:complete
MNNYKITEYKFRDGKLPKEQQVVWSFFVREGTMDGFIVAEVIINDIYKIKNMLNFLNLKEPSVVVDLGAQIGGFTKYCAVSFPNTKIFSYEATKENFDLLKKNVSNFSNVKIENKIVCGNKNPTKIEWDKQDKGLGLNTGGIRVLYEDNKKTLENNTTLSKIIEENDIEQIDFLKIDIEGSEYNVIEDAKRTGALKKVRCMVCELHVNPTRGRYFGNFIEHLDDFKYIKCLNNNNHRIIFALN